MPNIQVEDHVEIGLDRLIDFWKDKPAVIGLLTSFLEEIQELEDTLHQLNNERSLSTAIGQQLDVLGLLLGVERDGRLDNAYRDALRDRVSSIRASGTIEDVKRTAKILTDATICKVFNHYPACTYLFCNEPITKDYHEIIQKSHMAGVRTRTFWFNGNDYYTPSHDHTFFEYNLIDDIGDTFVINDGGVFNLMLRDSFPEDSVNGFTSLIPGSTEYETVDLKGRFASLSPTQGPEVTSGYIIDNNFDYIIDNNGNYISYISTTGGVQASETPLFITNLIWIDNN